MGIINYALKMSKSYRRLMAVSRSNWRSLPMLIPTADVRVGSIDLRLALALSGARAVADEDRLRLSLPGGTTTVFPVHADACSHEVLRDAITVLWRDVVLLDQYDASSVLEPGMVVLDAGANVGCFSVLAADLVGSTGRVVAVEPMSENLTCIEENVRSRDLANVTPVACAVGESDGSVELSISQYSGRHSAVLHRDFGTRSVPVRSVDSLVEELDLSRLDFLKADVEGMEPDLLAGATETIRRFRPRLALSAYHVAEHADQLPQLVQRIEPSYETWVEAVVPGLEPVMFGRSA